MTSPKRITQWQHTLVLCGVKEDGIEWRKGQRGNEAMRGLKAEGIPVTEEDRAELERLHRAHTIPQQMAVRAQIILELHATRNQAETARRVGVSEKMVRQWR